LVGLLCGVLLLWGLDSLGRMPRFGRPTQSEALRASRRNAIVAAVDRTRRSVVTIRVEGRRRITRPQDELLWLPFAPGRYGTFQWVGSGFFIDAGGFVLTNEHVVRDARRIIVSIADPTHGMSVQADLVGVAPQFDLALLRVPPPGRSPRSTDAPIVPFATAGVQRYP
jgi:S1-C subfamily serine protease